VPLPPGGTPSDPGGAGPLPPPGQPPHGPPPAAPARPTPPGRGRRGLAVLAAAGLVAASATGGALLALALDDDPAPSVATSLDARPTSGGGEDAPDEPLSQAAAAVLPSVVSISFESSEAAGSGSGIVISADGQILTNNHVVAAADGADLTVTLSDGTTADASIVGRDPATDLAVIKAEDVSGLTPATFGSSADLHVGDTVLAIGSPLGLDGSVSAGIVSALDRAITLQGGSQPQPPFGGGGERSRAGQTAVIDAIQTDAAINPGNSGGALINAKGEVVGINTAIASLAQGTTSEGGNIGVGFAIPIDSARDIAAQLVEDGSVSHAYLGVSIVDPADGTRGALVGEVQDGQPAAAAGLARGDVITKVGDTEVADAAGLTAAIRSHEPGDTVTVEYTRDGESHTVDVTLAELPAD
ncbi:MAG TPA: trypsin-like peptidase domain-containing protein, partial [Acidimicrobiales bacterium]|nr:trypsin-like peptidase domain-containing protein [Acidimicrobiales bacterium]